MRPIRAVSSMRALVARSAPADGLIARRTRAYGLRVHRMGQRSRGPGTNCCRKHIRILWAQGSMYKEIGRGGPLTSSRACFWEKHRRTRIKRAYIAEDCRFQSFAGVHRVMISPSVGSRPQRGDQGGILVCRERTYQMTILTSVRCARSGGRVIVEHPKALL